MAHAIFSIKKLTRGALAAAYKHNVREMEVKNADGSMSKLNEELIPAGKNHSYINLVDERLKELAVYRDKKIRSDAVHAFSVVVSLPKEAVGQVNLDDWKRKNLEWMDKTFNRNKELFGGNLLSAKLHMDESSPHIHAIIVPIDDKGHLNAYEYIHGPASLRQLQTSYADAMKEFGLERGLEYSVTKHTELKKFYTALNEAVATKAPDIIKGETIEQYKERADKHASDLARRLFAEKKQMEKERDAAITKEHQKTVEAKMELKETKHEFKKAKEELDELEHEIGEPIKDIVDKIESINAIQEAIEGMENPEEKEYAREFLNNMIKTGKEKQKENKKKSREQQTTESK